MRVCRRSARTRPATAITSTGPSPAHSFPLNEKSAHESCSKPSQPSRASRCTREASLHACCGWTRTNGLVARKARIASPTEIASRRHCPHAGHDQRHEQEDGGILRARCQTGGDARPLESAGDGERERHRDQRGHRHVRDRGVRVRDADRLDRDDGGRRRGRRSSRRRRGPATRRPRRRRRRRPRSRGGRSGTTGRPATPGRGRGRREAARGSRTSAGRGRRRGRSSTPAGRCSARRGRADCRTAGRTRSRSAAGPPRAPGSRRGTEATFGRESAPLCACAARAAARPRSRLPQSPRREAARRRRGGRPRPSR